jgi:hypothetical protein
MSKSRMCPYGRVLPGVAGLVLLSTVFLLGQGTTGTVTGVVTDPSGAVVPDATVTITNEANGAQFRLATNSSGVYFVTSLIPGTYTVEVAKRGFKHYLNRNQVLTVDQKLRLDVRLEVGTATQVIAVEAAAPLVDTEQGRLSSLVSATDVQNLPLNGRDVYSLMQLVPGAVNSTGIDMENSGGGAQANINGARANFNGFLFDGVANKGLSGGSNAEPAPDFIQEFRIETNNFDAQYSSSAGSIIDVSTKSGTNQFHGDAWEFFRNDKLNARNFFDGPTKSEWRQNQFGGTIGGPIKKDKLFFFGGYEGERFRTAVPTLQFIESPEFRNAVEAAEPNSVAALLYKSFKSPNPTSGTTTVDEQVYANVVNGPDMAQALNTPYISGTTAMLTDAYQGYLDPCFITNALGVGTSAGVASLPNLNWGNPQTVANRSAALFGVTALENAQIAHNIAVGCPGSGFTAPAVQNGTLDHSAVMNGFVNTSVTSDSPVGSVFYNGDQFTVKMDYQGQNNRMFGRFYYLQQKNPNVNPTSLAGPRGFVAPSTNSYPHAAYAFVHSFSPFVVNEFDAGFTRNQLSDIPNPSQFGVPEIDFDTGEPSFGAYNGYPQFFNENVFNFKDMVVITKGNHSLKVGAEFKRNYENSEFNVGRPDYAVFDPVYFAADLPYIEAAGVNPELVSGGSAHLDTNIRAWRNYELGLFAQDDWKITRNFTVNLGLRWDYFSPHTEKYHQATQLALGPGSDQNSKLASINCESFLSSSACLLPFGDTNTPNGGFTRASSLFPSRYGNFAPRVGFAWDPRGDGKMSLRGAAALSYEGTFYNALSNSRWNLPFYSFNEACPAACSLNGLPTYGPTNPDGSPNTTVAPTFSGAPSNAGAGPGGLGFLGNIQGWLPSNPDLAHLTGIPSPNYKLPYVEQFFLGVQRELSPSIVLEVNGVMTLGKHLFWAEDPNRVVGGKQNSTGRLDPCTGQIVPKTPYVNPCFGILRTWETSVNSSYEALQVSLNKKFSHGLAFTTNYTWAHSIDMRSTWHALTSGGSATDVNAVGESGYSMDPNRLYLERGNSLFDIRHRGVATVEWDLPWLKGQQGFAGRVLGGWTMNTNVSLQTGFPFTIGAASKDFNGTGIRGQRPNAPSAATTKAFNSFGPCAFEANCKPGLNPGDSFMKTFKSAFPSPAPGTDGTLGRNTFRGPGIADTDFSLLKKIPLGSNEARYFQFRAEFFNLFNRTNLYPPNANLSSGTFGLSTQAFDPRIIQFGLKLFF